jgi:flagellar hook protein FlgE
MASYSIPLSGLQADSSLLNVISNNLANLNTDGYKDQTLNFGDVFAAAQGSSGNGDPIQIGSGVQVTGTTSNFSNGDVDTTGIDSNMAIQGNGMFVVQSPNGGETAYTRDGDFTVNSSGQLVTPSGQLVMGYGATNGVVSTSGILSPITVDGTGSVPGEATANFQMTTNLDSSATVGTTFSTPITVYDSLGTPQTLTVQFTNTGVGAWSYAITLPAAATGGTGAPTTITSGTMTFDQSGNLLTPAGGSVTPIAITGLADNAKNMSLTWNLDTPGGTTSTITQLNSASATSATTQDGYGVGTLTGFSVASDGTIQGQFSNDQTQALGQVALASFGNVQGLSQGNDGDYQATPASGAAVLGVANAGGNGSIQGSAVEESNVDLSAEFSNLIVAQQAYEANAKALTTFDQIAQATIQLVS